ncbi:MAG: hypothetical protein ACRCZQ_10205 [Bacteroidales bacterium]
MIRRKQSIKNTVIIALGFLPLTSCNLLTKGGDGVAAPRICVEGEGDQAKLMITTDPTNYGAYFQFGSIIGWDIIGSESISVQYFNPTDVSVLWNENWVVGETFPEHTAANLRKGKGDPCRLAGFTVAEVKSQLEAGNAPDNGVWRMPTNEENIEFGAKYSRWTTLEGINGRYFGHGATPIGTGGEFLPAAGFCLNTDGTLICPEISASYWSSTANYSSYIYFGYYLNIFGDHISAENCNMQAYGYSVRCVPQQ